MTRYHALTAAELDAIASGDLDAQIIETLLSGQYSKRIIMISAVLTAAAEHCPGALASMDAAYSLLAAVQQADPLAVRATLTHPSVGFWAARCLSGLQSPSADPAALAVDLGQLASFAATAAIRAGHAFAIEVPVCGGTVFLPTLGLATLALEASATADSPVFATVSYDERRVTVSAGRSVVALPSDPERDGPGWQGLRRLHARHDGVSIAAELDDLDPYRGFHGAPVEGRLDQDTVTAWQSLLNGAWETLTRHHSRRARALAAGIRYLVPLRPANESSRSGTNSAGFGGHMLTPPRDHLLFAETLIHEFHHSVLSAVADLAPLHTAGSGAVHYSPWRSDPRPIDGLLQGAYAYLGVGGYWAAQRKVLTGPQQALADYEFTRCRHQVFLVARTLAESGTLTPSGITTVQGMLATAEHWRDMPVAEEPRALAEQAVRDHWVRWCLRNRHPARESIDAIAYAWQEGQRCPQHAEDVPSAVQPQQQMIELSTRTHLVHLRLSDPGSFEALRAGPSSHGTAAASASAADLDYAADDFQRAAEGYRAVIHATPGDNHAWSGLLLCAELAGQTASPPGTPEVIRDVYLAILASTATAPDIDKLQAWMES